jgi:hypothetical protein
MAGHSGADWSDLSEDRRVIRVDDRDSKELDERIKKLREVQAETLEEATRVAKSVPPKKRKPDE